MLVEALRFKQALARLKDENPDAIEEIRGSGLMIGLKMRPPVGDVVKACLAERLLVVSAGENVLRLLPPLNATEEELAEATGRIGRALSSLVKPRAA